MHDEDLIGSLDRRSEIEDILYENLPNHRNKVPGRINQRRLAEDLGIRRQAVNYWFTRAERIPPEQVTPLTLLKGSTLTVELLFPFCIKV